MVSIYPKFILYTFCLLSYPSLGKGERRENLRQVRKIHRRMWKELDNSWGDGELILWVLPKKNLLHPLVLERMPGRVRVWGRGEDLGLRCYLMGLSVWGIPSRSGEQGGHRILCFFTFSVWVGNSHGFGNKSIFLGSNILAYLLGHWAQERLGLRWHVLQLGPWISMVWVKQLSYFSASFFFCAFWF